MKFANVSDFLTDSDVETKGVALELGDGRKIFVKRAGGANKRYGILLQAKMKPHKFQIDNNILPEEKSKQILYEAAAEGLVCGWNGFMDEQGAEIEYSPAACVQLFTEAPEIYRAVMLTAQDLSTFRKEQLKQDGEVLGK